jgi:hypothetical protein
MAEGIVDAQALAGKKKRATRSMSAGPARGAHRYIAPLTLLGIIS